MNKKHLVWIPSVIGVVLILVSQLDLYLFKAGVFGVRTLLAWEIMLVLAGMISCIVSLIYGGLCLFKKRWLVAFLAVVNSLIFLVLFSLGGALGAAYLNAA